MSGKTGPLVSVRPRNDDHSTEFGLWLREQATLPSSSYQATNIDYVWQLGGRNYRDKDGADCGPWMYLEEKRFGCWLRTSQRMQFLRLHRLAIGHGDPGYSGFHVLVFGATSPKDGWSCLDGLIVTPLELVEFLQYQSAPWKYERCVLQCGSLLKAHGVE